MAEASLVFPYPAGLVRMVVVSEKTMQYKLDITKYVDMLWEEVLSRKDSIMDWDRNDYKTEGSTHIHATCNMCKKDYDVWVEDEDYKEWIEGKACEKAFPYLSADDRELLISGTCGPCFDDMFGE